MQKSRIFRTLLLSMVAVCPLGAQDLDFSAVPKITPGVTNQGAVGAINAVGLLRASTPTSLESIRPVDVAVSGTTVYAVGDAGGRRTLIVLPSSPLSDGTFALPLAVRLATLPTSVAVIDIDLDALDDVIVVEGASAGQAGTSGTVEVFSGQFLSTGNLTNFDRSDLADTRDGVNTNHQKIITTSKPLSVTTSRLDGDAFGDIAYVTDTGSVEVILGVTTGFTSVQQIGTVTLPTPVNPSPDAIDADVLNVASSGQSIDATPDIAVGTSTGATIFVTVPNPVAGQPPTFEALTLTASTGSSVLLADVTRDNLVDVILLNRGPGNLSTNVASANGGYGAAITSSAVGSSAAALSLINFNNDDKPDLVVPRMNFAPNGKIVVLTGNGLGGFTFTPATTLNAERPTSVAAAGAQGDDLVFGSFYGLNYLANNATVLAPARMNVVTNVSPAASLDSVGTDNDVVVIEQNKGIVFVLRNITGDSTNPTVSAIDLNDIFTTSNTSPTSATTFRDAQTNLINIAVTDITTPTSVNGFGQIVVLLNDGTGTFTDFGSFRQFVATPGATNIMSGDFNNDGDDDLAYIDFHSNSAAVMLNDGANFFLTPQFRETGAFVPVSARIGDINDDDRLDLVVAHPGDAGQSNASITTLFGNGTGALASGQSFAAPDHPLAVVGGVENGRIVDFNLDGFPDFAVASTRGAVDGGTGIGISTVTLFINQPDSPGNFTVNAPIQLVDSPNPFQSFQLEGANGGPGVVSGRSGDPSIDFANLGLGSGGANYVMSVADFNADGSPDLVVAGTTLRAFDADFNGLGDAGTPLENRPGVPSYSNFRSAIYLFGDTTAGTVNVAPPIRDYAEGDNPFLHGGDAFVANATGNFLGSINAVPDVFHVSLNGNIWVDANTSSILNHAPIVTIPRSNLNAPLGQGRKHVITSGDASTVQVNASDTDSDTLQFSLLPPSLPFMAINPTTGLITINSAVINTGTSPVSFRIGVEATDASSSGPGGSLPRTGRAFFSLVVNPNAPPTVTLGNVSPNRGSTRGGETLTFTGTGFADGAGVTLGGTPATNVAFVSSTTLTATAPPHTNGLVPVIVTNPGGASATLSDGYRYGLFDPNDDGDVNLADLEYLAEAILGDGGPPAGSGDANGDGLVDMLDLAYFANHLFAGGDEPI